MKIVNPLHYPLAVLVSGIVLVVGVRFANLSSLIVLPLAGIIAMGGSVVLKNKESNGVNVKNPLHQEIKAALKQAEILVQKAEILRQEAGNVLTDSSQMELLTTIQYACDRAQELPGKIQEFSRKIQSSDSVLSVQDLEKQLQSAKAKKAKSSGVAVQHLEQLIKSLERNLDLTKQGENALQAQIISLSTWIVDSAGVLQHLQNNLRTSNLDDLAEIQELQNLSLELQEIQKNMEFLIV
jgi:hypothetical protein